ncbi:DNA-directed RNA polymerase subunit B'' [Candidatus Woesearchaeota archaeon]|nr:DNA-directed RNA polymerase subunit B'' [Candidatus Woesearchaeota archaeon]RLE40556.1 MAG: DNA-directed RNA polymerase subunit B'' [Candidatus Woesearchaeota archaeon]
MMDRHKVLIKKFFAEQSFIDSNIESFNNFLDKELQVIIDENKEIVPPIIPQDIEEFKIRLEKVRVMKPEVVEADGSRRPIFPMEARLRKLTYASPVYLDVVSYVNGVQRESFSVLLGNMPIMLKSKYCYLHGMRKEELIEHGEDPDDPGGYFIINGTEKVIICIEDLGANRLIIDKTTAGPSPYVGKIFSEKGNLKIPHTIERLKDGIFYLTFARVKRVPLVLILKGLGVAKDEDILNFVSKEKKYDEVIINLVSFANIKNAEEALDKIGKMIGITQPKETRIERMREMLDKYLLPHIGNRPEDRIYKAINLCKMVKRYIDAVNSGMIDDKDHYMNKRLKLSGDLLADLFRVNLKILLGDLLYNFQRMVKRGKFPSIKSILRNKLLTSRIYSAMATGSWPGNRQGICQRIQRLNFVETLSHLQRVVSPLSSDQENFAARELHATHLGRLCPIETPEGTPIGLRKNLALFCTISHDSDEGVILNELKKLGVRTTI